MNHDLKRLGGCLLAALLVGLALDQVAGLLIITLAGYLVWQHRKLVQLLAWVKSRKTTEPPDSEGLFEDISIEIERLRGRHKKRKQRLSQYLRKFQQATSALPDGTIVLGPDDDVQWANAAAMRQLGVRWPQDEGQRITNLIRNPEVQRIIEHGADSEASTSIRSPVDQEQHLSVQIVPYGDKQRLFVARDVTRVHRLNEVRRDFVANVSHELRTPVTVFTGYLDSLVADKDNCPETWKPALEALQQHSARMRDVIEELLLLSQLEQDDEIAEPELAVVPEMLGNIFKQAQQLSGERRHLISLEADPDLWLNGAPAELYSAFANLVFNAVRYTPARGVINIRWYRDDQGAHFSVRDNGNGIAPEHLPRLSERFYRVEKDRSRDSGGTGLGLAIVKHVLSRHGGDLHIESELGFGSTFRCDFPTSLIYSEQRLDLDELA